MLIQEFQHLFDPVDPVDGPEDLHIEIDRRLASASSPLDESHELAGAGRAGVALSTHVDGTVSQAVPAVLALEALVAREDRLTVLWWLRNDEQHLAVVIDTEPAELERGEMRAEVGPESVLKLMSFDAARDALGAAFLCAYDQHRVAVEVERGLFRTAVGGPQKELRDLRNTRLAGRVYGALDLEVTRLGLVADGEDVLKDAPQ